MHCLSAEAIPDGRVRGRTLFLIVTVQILYATRVDEDFPIGDGFLDASLVVAVSDSYVSLNLRRLKSSQD